MNRWVCRKPTERRSWWWYWEKLVEGLLVVVCAYLFGVLLAKGGMALHDYWFGPFPETSTRVEAWQWIGPMGDYRERRVFRSWRCHEVNCDSVDEAEL